MLRSAFAIPFDSPGTPKPRVASPRASESIVITSVTPRDSAKACWAHGLSSETANTRMPAASSSSRLSRRCLSSLTQPGEKANG